MTLAGLEPAIFGSEDQRLIRYATGPYNGSASIKFQTYRQTIAWTFRNKNDAQDEFIGHTGGFGTVRINSEWIVVIRCSKNERPKSVLHVTISGASTAELIVPGRTAEPDVFTHGRFVDG